MDLLAADGNPTLLRIEVPGPEALAAAHPFFSMDDLRRNGDLPNVVKYFIYAWSYSVCHPGFQPRTLQADCGFVFQRTIPGSWIREVSI